MYADDGSRVFGECLAANISPGICECALFGITGPANLLFRLDKVFRRSTSALTSNSPFLTFSLVSSGGWRKKKRRRSERGIKVGGR